MVHQCLALEAVLEVEIDVILDQEVYDRLAEVEKFHHLKGHKEASDRDRRVCVARKYLLLYEG